MTGPLDWIDSMAREAIVAFGANLQLQRYSATGASLTGSALIGAAAMGAVAVGALAIGGLAIGRMRVAQGRFDRLHIGTLSVDRVVYNRRRRRA